MFTSKFFQKAVLNQFLSTLKITPKKLLYISPSNKPQHFRIALAKQWNIPATCVHYTPRFKVFSPNYEEMRRAVFQIHTFYNRGTWLEDTEVDKSIPKDTPCQILKGDCAIPMDPPSVRKPGGCGKRGFISGV